MILFLLLFSPTSLTSSFLAQLGLGAAEKQSEEEKEKVVSDDEVEEHIADTEQNHEVQDIKIYIYPKKLKRSDNRIEAVSIRSVRVRSLTKKCGSVHELLSTSNFVFVLVILCL